MKSSISLLHYWADEQFDSAPKTISHFGCTNIIFTDYRSLLHLNRDTISPSLKIDNTIMDPVEYGRKLRFLRIRGIDIL